MSMFPPIPLRFRDDRKRHINTRFRLRPDQIHLRLPAVEMLRGTPEEKRGTADWDATINQWLFLSRRDDAVSLGLWNGATGRQVELSRRTVEPLGFYDFESDRWERFVAEERARREQLAAR